MKIYIVRCMYGELKAFSCPHKAQTFCDDWNSLLPVFREFEILDAKMYDAAMDMLADNLWGDTMEYWDWREDTLNDLGIADTFVRHSSAYEVEELEIE